MNALELLAKSFALSCDSPHVTLVIVWDKTVCGIDTWWKTEDQALVLEGLLKQGAVPVGWISMDENLDPLDVHPLGGQLPESLEREVLLSAHEAKTGRTPRWMRRNAEFFSEQTEHEAALYHLCQTQQVECEWGGFIAGMVKRVQKGGRP